MLRIGQTIKKWRGSHGLSQSQLATKLGVSFRSVVYWEAGQRIPRQKLVIDRLKEVIPELREHPDLRGKKEVTARNLEMKSSPSLPDNFPVEIGINFYNKDFESCIDEYFSYAKTERINKKLLEEYKEKLIGLLEDSYLTLKDTMDRAILKGPPKSRDEDFLKESFKPGYDLSWRKDRKEGICIPDVTYSPNISALLASWTLHIWRGDIKARKCGGESCHRIFLLKQGDKLYCSGRCRVKAFRARRKKVAKEM